MEYNDLDYDLPQDTATQQSYPLTPPINKYAGMGIDALQQRQLEESAALIKEILQTDEVMATIEHKLRGEVYIYDDKDRGKWVKKRKAIIDSEEAIGELLSIIETLAVNAITTTTCTTEEEVNEKLLEFEVALANLVCGNQAKWNIPKTNVHMVLIKIRGIVADGVMRSRNGNLLKTLRSVYQSTEYSQTDKKKKGIIPNPFGGDDL